MSTNLVGINHQILKFHFIPHFNGFLGVKILILLQIKFIQLVENRIVKFIFLFKLQVVLTDYHFHHLILIWKHINLLIWWIKFLVNSGLNLEVIKYLIRGLNLKFQVLKICFHHHFKNLYSKLGD